MREQRFIALSLVLTAGLIGVTAQQRDTTRPENRTTGTTARADESFVKEAAMGGLAEVDLGKLAADKAHADAVKQFGRRMVDDHGAANQQLQQLAATKSIS